MPYSTNLLNNKHILTKFSNYESCQDKLIKDELKCDKMTADLTDILLQKVFKDEEKYNIVLSIREELMTRVMDECYKSYLKKQTIRFIVQCSYDALVKFLSFNFYYHPNVPDVKQAIWIPDEPIPSSPKDTWSCDGVPIRPANYVKEEEDEIIFPTKLLEAISKTELSNGSENKLCKLVETISTTESLSGSENKLCKCLEHPCTCLTPTDELLNKIDNTCEKKPSRGSRASIKSGITRQSKQSTLSNKSTVSKPNVIKEVSTNESTSYVSSVVASPKQIRKKKVDVVKTEEQEVNPVKSKGLLSEVDVASVVGLPPIRVVSKFQSKPEETKKKKPKR